MRLKQVTIDTASPLPPRGRVLIIYTGGTFGMARDSEGTLVPFDFGLIREYLPILKNLALQITVISFETPIDSSDMSILHWQTIGRIIVDHYHENDGFVVLHGTDTMAYTTSALSFMLQGLNKPVVFTGAQLPISEPRSDARENLITALEIATAREHGVARVPEVAICFDDELLRGNRSRKVESMLFDAFESGNYPPLAKAGVKITYNNAFIRKPSAEGISLLSKFDTQVAILKLFPGISDSVVASTLQTAGQKGVVLETFGSGNAPRNEELLRMLGEAIQRGVVVVNVSQCPGGMVIQGRYETSKELARIGVIGGGDMTTEAAVTKLMLMLGEFGVEETRKRIGLEWAGEMSGLAL